MGDLGALPLWNNRYTYRRLPFDVGFINTLDISLGDGFVRFEILGEIAGIICKGLVGGQLAHFSGDAFKAKDDA